MSALRRQNPSNAVPPRYRQTLASRQSGNRVHQPELRVSSPLRLEVSLCLAHGFLVTLCVALPHSHHDLGYTDLQANGLTRYADAEELARSIYKHSDLEQTCHSLIAIAHGGGAEDNVTCLLLRVR